MKSLNSGIKSILLSIIFVAILCTITSCGTTTKTIDTVSESNTTLSTYTNSICFTTDYFEDKYVVAYGDSITYGIGVSNINNLWLNVLKNQLHFTCSNFAQGGAVLPYMTGRVSICDEIQKNESRNSFADYAFIFIGTNDFASNVLIGNRYDKAEQLKDVSTFKQGIMFAVETLRKHNEDIIIIFILPINRYDMSMTRSDGKTLEDFRVAIESLSNKFDYYYVDTRDVFDSNNFNASSSYTSDALHPNDEGQKYLANYILNQEINN